MLLSWLEGGDGRRGGVGAGGRGEVAGQRDDDAARERHGPSAVGGRRERGRVRLAAGRAAAHAGGDQVAQHGDAEDRAELTGRGDDRGRDAGLRRGHAGHAGVRDRRVHQSQARAGDRQGSENPGGGRLLAEAEQHGHARRDEQPAGDERDARAVAGRNLARHRGGQRHHDHGGQDRQSRAQRRVAAHLLQVQGDHEQEPAEDDEGEHGDHAGAGERLRAEEPQLE